MKLKNKKFYRTLVDHQKPIGFKAYHRVNQIARNRRNKELLLQETLGVYNVWKKGGQSAWNGPGYFKGFNK